MRRHSGLLRRSRLAWSGRMLVAVAIGLVGWQGVTATLGYALKGDPDRAHGIAPGDARVASLLAQRLAGPNATAGDRRRADVLAREALRRDATTVIAMSTLGIDAQLSGEGPAARRMFIYAERLSRRDLQTELWRIEDAVGRGDVATALRHYDIALRTNRNASDLLFPVLASAISEPAVRSALTHTLAAQPIWGSDFINYVAGNGPDPVATATLYLALRRAGQTVKPEANAVVISALMIARRWDQAWSYYASTRPGVDRRYSRDPHFLRTDTIPAPFDWTPLHENGVSVSIQRGESGGIVDFTAPPSVGGPLLRQTQLLPPGTYRLRGHSSGVDQPVGSQPYWTLRCEGAAGDDVRVSVANTVDSGGLFDGRFTVAAGCSVQTLLLVALPSNAAGGLSGQIDRVQLAPAD